ncbi:MAG: hypothetical protein ACJ8CH_06475, partial [Microvirga sp.]
MLRLEFLELGVELVCWLRPNDSEVDDDAAVSVNFHSLRLAAGGFDSLDCRSHVSLTKLQVLRGMGPVLPARRCVGRSPVKRDYPRFLFFHPTHG